MNIGVFGLNLFFRVFILFGLILSSGFVIGFSADGTDSSETSTLQFVRDGMWDLAVSMYLYESVLFNPAKYFELDYSNSSNIEPTIRTSQIELNITPNNVWSTPVGPYVSEDNINFIPNQLFDITFNVLSGDYAKVSDIVAVVTFENFGTQLTRVELTYTLFNSSNNLIFTTSEFLDVESELSIFKEFKEDIILPSGDYKLVLETVYGDNVRDRFENDFIVSSGSSFFLSIWMIYIVGFIFFIFLMFIFLIIYRKFFTDTEEVISDFNNDSSVGNNLVNETVAGENLNQTQPDLNQIESNVEMENKTNLNTDNSNINDNINNDTSDDTASGDSDFDSMDYEGDDFDDDNLNKSGEGLNLK